MDKKDRDYWMRMELSQRVEEFTTEKPFNLFVGSRNVNNQSPPDTMLRSWLAADKQPPDIYVIGLQVKFFDHILLSKHIPSTFIIFLQINF